MKAWRRLKPSVRGGALAVGAAVLCWPLTTAAGVLAVATGTALGATLAVRVAASRIRTAPAVVLAALAAVALAAVATALTRYTLAASVIGPLDARALSELVLWAGLGGAVAFSLRLLSERVESMAVLELAVMTAAVAAALAAHRGGMIHRPFAVADWAWSRGLDPQNVLLVVGGLTGLAGVLLLFRDPQLFRLRAREGEEDVRRERRVGRALAHAVGLVLIALALLFAVQKVGAPKPRSANDLGLTGEPQGGGDEEKRQREEEQRRRGSINSGAPSSEEPRPEGASPRPGPGQAGQQGENQGELPFRNEYSSSGGEAPVAVVLFHDDYQPPSGIYYFRQSAFSQYNGVRLVQSTRDGTDRDVVELFPVARTELGGAPDTSGRRELSTTIGLIAEHQKPFALDTPAALWPVANPDPLRFRRAYAALSRVPTASYRDLLGRQPGLPEWTDEELAHYTAAPDQDPRYRELAEQIRAGLPEKYRRDPLALAFAVKLWLEENGTYSRRSQHADAADPTADFLFGDRIGYCVHFAHASAFLLRSLGVPARVAGGYAVDETRRGNGSALMIRGLDAHAWPEIPLPGAGWVVVDIAPRRNLDAQADQPDPSLQQMLGEAMRNGPQDATRVDQPRHWPSWSTLARGALVLAGLGLLGALVVKVYRGVLPAFATPRSVPRVAYRAALDRLADVGVKRHHGETRESFARRAAAVSPAFERLTARHLAWAHGSRRPLDAGEILNLGRSVSAQARGAVPGWRWVLGSLNPLSYLASR
jgi:transglutaminase-like putative cysteine protease